MSCIHSHDTPSIKSVILYKLFCFQGPVVFNSNGSRTHSNSQVFQYRLYSNGTLHLTPVALVDVGEDFHSLSYLGDESSNTIYPGILHKYVQGNNYYYCYNNISFSALFIIELYQ